MRIVLDPGHGGKDPGAVDPVDVMKGDIIHTEEDDLAYDIARRTQDILMCQGYGVYLTRRPNQFISLRGRCEFANGIKADVFVSIHLNSGPPQAHGFEVFSYPGSQEGAQLRDSILARLVSTFPNWNNRGGKENNLYYVLRHTNMPAVLIECGFVTHTEEERKLQDPVVRQQMAQAIADGIVAYAVQKGMG